MRHIENVSGILRRICAKFARKQAAAEGGGCSDKWLKCQTVVGGYFPEPTAADWTEMVLEI
jgi:hypothetical protein